MNTLILYATKYGAAAEIANRIAARIPEATVCDLKKDKIPPLSQFNCIIIGGSIYAGMLRKEAKEFVTQNVEALTSAKLGLYLSGMSTEKADEYFTANFPAEILDGAAATALLGGVFDPSKAGFISRFIMKKVANISEYENTISDAKLDGFVAELNRSL